MVEFEDTRSYLVIFLGPLAILSWLAATVARTTVVMQLALGGGISFAGYFALVKLFPDVFDLFTTDMLLTVLGTMGLFLLLIYFAASLVLLVALLTLAVPTIGHNAALVASWIGVSHWAAMCMLALAVALVAFLVYKSRIFSFVGWVLKIGVTSFFLHMMLRLFVMENPPAMDRLQVACWGSSDKDGQPPGRCPVAFDSIPWLALFLVIVVCQIKLAYVCRRKRKKEKKTTKKKGGADSKNKNKSVAYNKVQADEDEYETDPDPDPEG